MAVRIFLSDNDFISNPRCSPASHRFAGTFKNLKVKQMLDKSTRYLNFNELRAKIGNRGRTSIYRDVEDGRLPKPLKLGGRLYWVEADIDAAIAANAG